MAGYILYSLEHDKLNSFINAPTGKPLQLFSAAISDHLDEYDDEIDDDDPIAEWPSDPDELQPLLVKHLAQTDWYTDLSDTGKDLWERAFCDLCSDELMGFACESDGIYWNVVEEARKHHGVKVDVITDLEVTHFGTRPYHFHDRKKRSFDHWHPYHSMHSPQEVAKLAQQFATAEETILASRYDEVREDYEELMPVLDRVSKNDRILYVSVDT